MRTFLIRMLANCSGGDDNFLQSLIISVLCFT